MAMYGPGARSPKTLADFNEKEIELYASKDGLYLKLQLAKSKLKLAKDKNGQGVKSAELEISETLDKLKKNKTQAELEIDETLREIKTTFRGSTTETVRFLKYWELLVESEKCKQQAAQLDARATVLRSEQKTWVSALDTQQTEINKKKKSTQTSITTWFKKKKNTPLRPKN